VKSKPAPSNSHGALWDGRATPAFVEMISEDDSKPMPQAPFKAFIDFLDAMQQDIIVGQ
jgi:hypothetical protein